SQPKGFGGVLTHAAPVQVKLAEIEQPYGMPLLCCKCEPVERSAVIARNPPSLQIHHRQVDLGWGIASVGRFFKPAFGLLQVARSAGDRGDTLFVLRVRRTASCLCLLL